MFDSSVFASTTGSTATVVIGSATTTTSICINTPLSSYTIHFTYYSLLLAPQRLQVLGAACTVDVPHLPSHYVKNLILFE